jgi:hypothetical protein
VTGWQRWVPLSGIAFVVLFLVATFIVEIPGGDDPEQEVLDFYADSGNRTSVVISAYLYVLAAFSLLLFANRLRYVIHNAEGGNPLFATGALPEVSQQLSA